MQRQRRYITINSAGELMQSFLLELPPDYRFETTRLQIYPIEYFLPHFRIPTPLNSAPYSYLILQRKGSGRVQVNADIHSMRSRGALFVHRGSVVSLRSIHPSTTGWMIMYDESIMARMLRAEAMEGMIGMRAPIALSSETFRWIDDLCALLERELRVETGEHQPASAHLFGALVERLLAEGGRMKARPADRSGSVERRFRRLVFAHAITEGSVRFYADRLNVSENYLLRCVRNGSGRSPKEWIIDVRLLHAQKLLRTSDATVADVAMQSGFDDPSYFGRAFRRRFGISPRDFRTIAMQDMSE